MSLVYLVCVFDPWDNYTFNYVAFADKASAKSYKRHWFSPGNFGVSIIRLWLSVPVGKIIDRDNKYFERCRRAEENAYDYAYKASCNN